jgi:DNA repair protein RadD
VKTKRGDYEAGQLDRVMNTSKLVGDVISTWFKHGEDPQTIVYASSLGHSVHIRDEFRNAGITCEHIDGKTLLEEREAALDLFKAKQVRVITNSGVFTEGGDCPDIGGLASPISYRLQKLKMRFTFLTPTFAYRA